MNKKNESIHSFSNDILGELDAVGIAALIKAKEISPKEVIEASINRAKLVEPHLNAVVTNRYEEALATANEHTEGFFAGVPIFIKDMTLVEGIPTYFGSKAFANAKPATKTDRIAQQIFAQGFVNMGTSSMPEFTCSTEFPMEDPTRNPWNLKHSAGGSSGGAAALVAAGVLPLAHAADGGGSIRIPAACNGLVGLKVTRGRTLLSSLFDKQLVEIAGDGVITRTVRDTAYFYAEAEKYYKNKKLKPIGLIEGPSNKKFTIGYTVDSLKDYTSDKITKEALQETVELLEYMGHTLIPITSPIPDQFMDDFVNLWGLSAYLSKKFAKKMIDPSFEVDKLSKLTNGLANHFRKNMLKAPFFITRLRQSKRFYAKMLKNLGIDMVLTPTTAHPAPELGHLGMDLDFEEMFPRMMRWACFTPYSNACGAPSISLPTGFDEKNNIPIGMMFWAGYGEDADLIDLAYQVEAAQPWRKING